MCIRDRAEIHRVIVGQEEVLDQLLIALQCNGHVLLTGVPGLAKTLLIKTLANLFRLNFNRIQCTPDLMPSDISGVEILDENVPERRFGFIEGPVFTNLLLADEFNRTSLGLDSAAINAAMAAEGMTADDGAPADLIRNYFDESTAGPGTPTVRDKLSSEVYDTIDELLSSGFGSVNSISTSYVNFATQFVARLFDI